MPKYPETGLGVCRAMCVYGGPAHVLGMPHVKSGGCVTQVLPAAETFSGIDLLGIWSESKHRV